MKKWLFALLMILNLGAAAQKSAPKDKAFPDLNVGVMAPTGFVGEIGKYPVKTSPLGYFIGTSVEFGNQVDGNFDLSVYGKGQLYLIKNLHAVVQFGLVDGLNLQAGLGLRGIIPTKGPDIYIEPLLRTRNSVVNIGLRTKL